MVSHRAKTPVPPFLSCGTLSPRGADMPELQPCLRSYWLGIRGRRAALRTEEVAKSDQSQIDHSNRRGDIFSNPFVFDKPCANVPRNKSFLPPLTRNIHIRKPANLLPLRLSPSHREQEEENISPTLPLSPVFTLDGQKSFAGANYRLTNKPSANCSNRNRVVLKYTKKYQYYPDPLTGAPWAYVHRISELSSMESKTVDLERSKKRKTEKPSS